MTLFEQIFLILGMSLVTYIPRALPLLFLSSKELPLALMRWLEMVPPAVLSALLISEICFTKENNSVVLFFSVDNTFLLAAIPTFIIGLFARNFFVTIAVGMISVVILRYLLT